MAFRNWATTAMDAVLGRDGFNGQRETRHIDFYVHARGHARAVLSDGQEFDVTTLAEGGLAEPGAGRWVDVETGVEEAGGDDPWVGL